MWKHPYQKVVFLILFVLLALMLVACPRPSEVSSIRIDKVILYPFTAENIKTPDPTGTAISKAPLGSTIALVGTGLSDNPQENTLTIDGFTQESWVSSSNFAAFILTGDPQNNIEKVTLSVKGQQLEVPLILDPVLPSVTDPDTVIQEYRDIMTRRYLSEGARNFVAKNFTEKEVARLDALRPPFVDFESRLEGYSGEEKLQIAALIDQTGIIPFFAKHPPAAIMQPPNLVDVETVLAEIAIGATLGGAVGSKDGPPSATFPNAPTFIIENIKETITCTGADNTTFSVGESGLKDITVYLNKGEGTLNPASGTTTAATADPFTVSFDFTGKKTGRSRAGNITCRPSDGGGNIGTGSLDFTVSEAVSPKITSISFESPSPTKKQVGQSFKATIVSSDKPISPGEGVASGIDGYEFTYKRLSGLAKIDVTPGQFPGPPEEAAGPEDHTQELTLTCTEIGQGQITVNPIDTANNFGFGSKKLTCIAAVSFYQPNLLALPAGDLVGSNQVAINDPSGNLTEFTASFDVPDESTVSREGDVIFINSGAGIDITLAEAPTDPLFETVTSIQAIVDPELCGGDTTFTFSVIDGPNPGSVTNDTSLGETVGFIAADGIRMFRIEATSGQLCLTELGIGLAGL